MEGKRKLEKEKKKEGHRDTKHQKKKKMII
jgi:hypothetical protein